MTTIPEPNEWKCVRTGPKTEYELLSDACLRLYPYAVEWRDTVIACESLDGVFESKEAAAECAALDAFIAACVGVGLA